MLESGVHLGLQYFKAIKASRSYKNILDSSFLDIGEKLEELSNSQLEQDDHPKYTHLKQYVISASKWVSVHKVNKLHNIVFRWLFCASEILQENK